MRKWIASIVMVAGLAVVGCTHDDDKMGSSKKTMSGDVCSHCPGVQTATADGKCSACGMKLADACEKCPGTQTVTADGKCSGCGAMMKKM